MKIHIPEFRAMAKCNQHLDHGPIDIDLGPDVVRVVRCENCTSGMMSDDNKYIICCRLGVGMEFDDFCSCGERKDGTEC
jgi:hypothetical protein